MGLGGPARHADRRKEAQRRLDLDLDNVYSPYDNVLKLQEAMGALKMLDPGSEMYKMQLQHLQEISKSQFEMDVVREKLRKEKLLQHLQAQRDWNDMVQVDRGDDGDSFVLPRSRPRPRRRRREEERDDYRDSFREEQRRIQQEAKLKEERHQREQLEQEMRDLKNQLSQVSRVQQKDAQTHEMDMLKAQLENQRRANDHSRHRTPEHKPQQDFAAQMMAKQMADQVAEQRRRADQMAKQLADQQAAANKAQQDMVAALVKQKAEAAAAPPVQQQRAPSPRHSHSRGRSRDRSRSRSRDRSRNRSRNRSRDRSRERSRERSRGSGRRPDSRGRSRSPPRDARKSGDPKPDETKPKQQPQVDKKVEKKEPDKKAPPSEPAKKPEKPDKKPEPVVEEEKKLTALERFRKAGKKVANATRFSIWKSHPHLGDVGQVFLNVSRATRPPSMEEFTATDGFDVYIDGCRFLPVCSSISAVSLMVFQSDLKKPRVVGSSEKHFSKECNEYKFVALVDQPKQSPQFHGRAEYHSPDLNKCPSATLLLRIDTIDLRTGKLAAVGYSALQVFLPLDWRATKDDPSPPNDMDGVDKIRLNEGRFQLPVYQHPPMRTNKFTEAAMEDFMRVPGTSILVRIVRALKGGDGKILHAKDLKEEEAISKGIVRLPPPAYKKRAYVSARAKPQQCEEQLLANHDAAAERKFHTVRESFSHLLEHYPLPGGKAAPKIDTSEDLEKFWLAQYKKPKGMLGINVMNLYNHAEGFMLRVESVLNVAKRGFSNTCPMVKVFYSTCPPAAYYQKPPKFDQFSISRVHMWEEEDAQHQYFDDNYTLFRQHKPEPKLCIILDVQITKFNFKSRNLTLERLGWTFLPVIHMWLDGALVVPSDTYTLPVYEGTPKPEVMAQIATALQKSGGSSKPPFPDEKLSEIMEECLKKRLVKVHRNFTAVQVSVIDSQIFGCVGMHPQEYSNNCFVPLSLHDKFELESLKPETHGNPKSLQQTEVPRGVDEKVFEKALNKAVESKLKMPQGETMDV